MISIIIPTLNEEKYLPGLLESIKNQSFKDLEIIVSDAGSFDKTREIAKSYECRIIEGGLPAVAKNNGAKIAKGEILIFIDADMRLGENELDNAVKEFKARKLKVASTQLQPLEKGGWRKLIFNLFYNWPIILLEKILPHGAGFIMIKKDLFEEVGGFDEKIILEEDQDFIRRAARKGKFGILRSLKPFYSIRRFEKEGWIRSYLKYLLCEIYSLIFGHDKGRLFKYKFGHYNLDVDNKKLTKKNKKNKLKTKEGLRW
jgi:glycosyltransferase involved in cell wall biosynthesis